MKTNNAPIATPQPCKAVAVLHRITQRQIAEATRVPRPVVCLYLNGLRPPTVEFARAVAELLALPEHALFSPERAAVSARIAARRGRKAARR